MDSTNKKNFGYDEFPKSSSNSGRMKPNPTPEWPTAGKPKSQVNAGATFPKTIRPGSESEYQSKK